MRIALYTVHVLPDGSEEMTIGVLRIDGSTEGRRQR